MAITTSVNAYYLYKSNSYLIDGVVVANSSTVNNNTIVTYVNCGKITYPLIMETQSNEANIIVVPKDTAQYKAFTINIPINKSKQYEIYIKSSKYYCTILGYLKKELCIDDLTRNATDIESLSYMLFSYIYDPFNMETTDYNSYLTAIKAKYESEMYNPNDDIEFMASVGLSEEDLETLQNVVESLSRPIDAMDWTDLQDRPQRIPP